MTINGKHSPYGVQLDDAVPVMLGGIEVVNVKTETESRVEATSGDIYARHMAIVSQKPSADFTSFALQDCLDQIGIAGLSIADLANGLNLYAYKHADGGGRETGASHRKYNMTKGLIVPNRITCDHRGDARVMYNVLPVWDGANDPFTISDATAVPTAANDDERFTIGKVVIGGVTVVGIRSLELNFGMNSPTEGADSDIFDTHVSVDDVKPVLSLRGIDIEWLKSTNVPLSGKAAAHSNTTIYLRKRLQTGAGYVADATVEHIKITMYGLAWIDDVFASQNSGASEASLKVAAAYDGTNLPVVITTASAIT